VKGGGAVASFSSSPLSWDTAAVSFISSMFLTLPKKSVTSTCREGYRERERGGKKGKENIKEEGGGGWRKGETVVLTKVKGGIEFVRSIARGSVWRSEIVQMC